MYIVFDVLYVDYYFMLSVIAPFNSQKKNLA